MAYNGKNPFQAVAKILIPTLLPSFFIFFLSLLNSSKKVLVTHLQLVCKLNFVRYSHINEKKLALYVPWFNSDGPLKSKVSHLKNLRFFKVQALDPKFVLALKPRVLKLEGSSYGIRPSIYVLKGKIFTPAKTALKSVRFK